MTLRFKAVVEYDGTAYFGFQRQIVEQPTIQGELERALQAIAHQPVTLVGAGRTDSGVHATGQVISFDLEWKHNLNSLQRALNANLPFDISIRQIATARPNFHPRYDAQRRAYRYYVYNAPYRSPLRHQRSWYVRSALDMSTMNEAANCLVGRFDFATFGQPPQGTSTIREIFSAKWDRQAEFLVFSIEANAFLYRMVRSIVGSLKFVGQGKWSAVDFSEALLAKDRGRAGSTAPPQGLYLVSVTYDEGD